VLKESASVPTFYGGDRAKMTWAVRLPMFRRSQVLGIRWCTEESDQSFDVLGSGIVWSCPG
jgi:hypothetical protein